jgi:hypothetical protein
MINDYYAEKIMSSYDVAGISTIAESIDGMAPDVFIEANRSLIRQKVIPETVMSIIDKQFPFVYGIIPLDQEIFILEIMKYISIRRSNELHFWLQEIYAYFFMTYIPHPAYIKERLNTLKNSIGAQK